MRKTTIFFLLILCSLAAFGQVQPQWRVVQHVALAGQSAAIPQTTVFTPTKRGLYRLSAYLTAGGKAHAGWELRFSWNDLDGHQLTTNMDSGIGNPNQLSTIFSPQTGVPFSFMTVNGGSGGWYDIAFTIEQLK